MNGNADYDKDRAVQVPELTPAVVIPKNVPDLPGWFCRNAQGGRPRMLGEDEQAYLADCSTRPCRLLIDVQPGLEVRPARPRQREAGPAGRGNRGCPAHLGSGRFCFSSYLMPS
ncbi:MAG: hypothetical protein ACTFAL_10735 [Candidatus Electronema sp. V4]|uniref:hypothetical protein n=1 Tax=Candidatus Electronema sp. V4 TaxID=3454756 RepID=UPI0040556E67